MDRLIDQLGSERIEERDAAEEKLFEMGEAAVEALRKAEGSRDPEIALRARRVRLRIVEGPRLDRVRALPRTFAKRRLVSIRSKIEGELVTLERGGRLLFDDQLGNERIQQYSAIDPAMTPESLTMSLETDEGAVGVVAVKVTPRSVTPWSLLRLIETLPQHRGYELGVDLVGYFGKPEAVTLSCAAQFGILRRVWTVWKCGELRFWLAGGRVVRYESAGAPYRIE